MKKPLDRCAMPLNLCPHCGRPINQTSPADGQGPGAAQPGDVTICLGCANVSILDGHRVIRALDLDDLAVLLNTMPGLAEAVARARRQAAVHARKEART